MAKSAAERAQEYVEHVQKRVDRLTKKRDQLAPQLEQVEADLKLETAELEHAKSHPALAGGAAQSAEADNDLSSPELTKPAPEPVREPMPGEDPFEDFVTT